MLDFTKNQILLLEIFFNHPEKAFYLRELGKLLNKQPGVFQADINELVKSGLLADYYQANSRFFKINKEYPIYPELKKIFLKIAGITAALKEGLKNIRHIKKAFIYGSYASGKEKAGSDVDLFVIGTINEGELLKLVNKLEQKFTREINYTLISEKEFKKKQKEGNSFIKNVLNKKIISLI
ncbi:MAG: nucleotidyltransferase domain-containing protein [Parcubacteria group bacterium]